MPTYAEAIVIQKNRKPARKRFKQGSDTVKINDHTYMMDPDYAVFHDKKVMGIPLTVVTYYFVEKCPTPVPFPNLASHETIGIKPEDFDIIYDPHLFRMLINAGKDNFAVFTLVAAILAVVVSLYAAYQVTEILNILEAAQQAAESASQSVPPST